MKPYFELTEHDNGFYFDTKDTHAKDSILLFEGSERIVQEEHIFTVPEDEEFIYTERGKIGTSFDKRRVGSW